MASQQPPQQLALTLPHAESLSRDDFLEGPSNAAALALIDRWPDWPAAMLVICGPEGAGKSHLAAIWATRAGARTVAARSLTVAEVPEALTTGAVALENVAPGKFDERALFHLINLAREQGCFVLMTARSLPSGWTLEVPDLASRLRAVPVANVAPPDDALLRGLIVKLCADRQMEVDEALVNYVASRIERSFAAVHAIVARLDAEALRLRRPVTRALAVELMRDSLP
ncbi:MAG: chromosomal replication initiator DnaA [Xanthobacteraceae bacterium]|nr:MAG: chromosomal replication initiator DnaA [Xanthobacteraceae bacterium]